MRSTSPFPDDDVSRNSHTVTREGRKPGRSDHVSSGGSIGLQNFAEPRTSQSRGPHSVSEEEAGKFSSNDDIEDKPDKEAKRSHRKPSFQECCQVSQLLADVCRSLRMTKLSQRDLPEKRISQSHGKICQTKVNLQS